MHLQEFQAMKKLAGVPVGRACRLMHLQETPQHGMIQEKAAAAS